ncbi:hemolysin family protein [Azospirillum picis]|uniref:CBS domain containing-hemolysin-like protein n=1 Tax=Azospirillum picis TaxID=488438 RepID=A0ABU0MLL2_9PROT|nr:hemolysin family protein [Azospirillum picis]MBP2300338.1 CBS domain containing-hemolysin-like protein [Azospirillum picis]MDQ0534134.1 CBS domain containing-hemolysin-like protein [Azospirillum picis]
MSDISDSRTPREDHGAEDHSLGHLFKGWLRTVWGGREDTSLRGTIEELIAGLDDAAGDDGGDALGAGERALLTNILKLRDRSVADVMVPRADIVAVDIDTPFPALVQRVAEEGHSRLPVFRETLDDVVGIIHIKDVLTMLAAQAASPAGLRQKPDLTGIIREAKIVAPSMHVLDLLVQMRQTRQHMALVVDEFGGIDGLVTIEDLVEEIVGEIEDEHDETLAPRLVERPDGSLIADARLPIEDFEVRVGPVLTDEEREDIDTLGGLVVSIAGRVPGPGERLSHPSGLEFEIVDADSRRLKRLRVHNVPANSTELAETA